MSSTRRDFFSSLTGVGLAGALGPANLREVLGSLTAGAEAGGADPGLPQEGQDKNSYDFWTSNIREPAAPRSRSLDGGGAPRVAFVYFDKRDGFVTGSDITDVGLPDRGDLNLLVNVDHIHLSQADQGRFAKLQGGSLRIDLQQTEPLPSLAEQLAWTAIAGVLSQTGGAANARDMSFNPGTTWGKLQSVPLPGGGGRWTWNFFLQQRKGRWVQLLESLRKDGNSLMPIFGLGLPAIAVTALRTVDRIVAELTKESGTEWLFQSPDVFVYGTKKARDLFEGSKLRLKQGMYVLVPENQLAGFAKQAPGLEIKDGLLVPQNTKSLDVFEAAKHTLTDVTYLTVGVRAKISNAV